MSNEGIMDASREATFEFLRAAGLLVDSNPNMMCLSGQIIPRDLLVSHEKYDECRPKLMVLKDWMSSSRLSCLQSTAEDNQKWPLLNAVRQLLRLNGFKMTPFRMSEGYTKDGKKKLRRFFLIEKLKSTSSDIGDKNIDTHTDSYDETSNLCDEN